MATKALNGPVGPQHIRTYYGPPGLTYGIGVKQGAMDGACLAVTGAGQKPLGIILNSDLVDSGVYGIVEFGEVLAIADGAIGCDVEVMLDANGLLTPSTAQGDYVLGRTRSSSTEANQEVVVFVCPYIR